MQKKLTPVVSFFCCYAYDKNVPQTFFRVEFAQKIFQGIRQAASFGCTATAKKDRRIRAGPRKSSEFTLCLLHAAQPVCSDMHIFLRCTSGSLRRVLQLFPD